MGLSEDIQALREPLASFRMSALDPQAHASISDYRASYLARWCETYDLELVCPHCFEPVILVTPDNATLDDFTWPFMCNTCGVFGKDDLEIEGRQWTMGDEWTF